MRINKLSIVTLLGISCFAFPVLAKKSFDHDQVLGAPQPYLSDIGNVQISLQTVNNYIPVSDVGPTTYLGTATVNIAINNLSNTSVNVSCTASYVPRVCVGTSIKSCTWGDDTPISFPDFSTPTPIPASGYTTTSITSTTATTTELSGWGLEIYNTTSAGAGLVQCTITDSNDSTNSITQNLFIPVA